MIFGIVVILTLVVAIALHELSHLLVAKAFGMKVQEYFVGFGPRLWSRRIRGVEVGVKAIPAGGYVKIPGMDLAAAEDPEPGTYASKPWYAQTAVALAGPASHFVIAFFVLVLTLGFASSDPFGGTAGVSAVIDGSPAAVAGLERGDVITSIDGIAISGWDEARKIIASQPTTSAVVDRDGAPVVLAVSNWRGVVTPPTDPISGSGPVGVLGSAATALVDFTELTVDGLVSIVGDFDDVVGAAAGTRSIPEERPVSVIGIVSFSSQTGSGFGWYGVGLLIAQVNIGLGLLNLLPFHPFDGGHAAASVVNRVFRCRWIRKPVLRGMGAMAVPVLAILLTLFAASAVIDVRVLG